MDLREEGLDPELALSGNLELHWHLEYDVGLLPVGPARGKSRCGRQIRVVAARRSGVSPRGDCLDLLVAQTDVVSHRQRKLGIRAPRRHFPIGHLGLDRFGPRPSILVRQERHGRHFAGAVALRALVEHDRSDVFGEGRSTCLGRLRRGLRHDGGGQRQASDQHEQQPTSHRRLLFTRHNSSVRV
jgi:hypothetical protein